MGDIEAFPNNERNLHNERNLPGIFDFTWYIPTIRSRCIIIESKDSIAVMLKIYCIRTVQMMNIFPLEKGTIPMRGWGNSPQSKIRFRRARLIRNGMALSVFGIDRGSSDRFRDGELKRENLRKTTSYFNHHRSDAT